MVDTGLLVRYYIDEAASGQTPTDVLDRSGVGSALDLALTYDSTDLNYVEVSGQRGLECTDTASDSRAEAAIAAGNKVFDGIHNSQTATIEVVCRIDNFAAGGGRVICINDTTANARLGFYGISTTSWRAAVNGPTNGSRTWSGPLNTRVVYHIVVDTTQATADDRVKVYEDGVLLSPTVNTNPDLNALITLNAGSKVFLFNRGDSSWARSIDGTIYYAALYDHAFSDAEVEENYDELVLDDDTPAAGGQDIAPTGLASGAALGTPAVAPGVVNIAPSGIGSGSALGSPAVAPGVVSITVDGIGSGSALGSPTVLLDGAIQPAGIASTVTIGAPTVAAGAVNIAPSGIGSGTALGSPAVSPGAVTITATGIASTAGPGAPVVTAGAVNIAPTGIGSGAVFGTPAPASVYQLTVTGIGSTIALGVPVLSATGAVAPAGIASTAALGAPTLGGGSTHTPVIWQMSTRAVSNPTIERATSNPTLIES